MFSPCAEASLPQMLASIVDGLHSVCCLWAQPIRRLIPLKYLQANDEARARGLLIWFNKACLIWAYRKDWKTEGKSCYVQQKPICESSEVSKVNFRTQFFFIFFIFICVSCNIWTWSISAAPWLMTVSPAPSLTYVNANPWHTIKYSGLCMCEPASHPQPLSKCELTLAHKVNKCRKWWLFWLLDYNLHARTHTHTRIFNSSFGQHVEQSHISSLRLIHCSISTSGRLPNFTCSPALFAFQIIYNVLPVPYAYFIIVNSHSFGLVHISTGHHFFYFEKA